MWKIERDSYYGELYHKFGTSFISKAGFFEDTDAVNRRVTDSVNILCTPLAHLDRKAPKPAILLSTGSYCPVHYGHIQMMLSAKKAVEAAGYGVIGGYLSPSHDEYVKAKTGHGWIPDFARLKQIRDAITDHSWMQIDPWESVFNKVAINFTDVVDRLKAYVKKHTGIDADIFYVCGGDNARFALTFALKGHCVIVSRPGYAGQVLNDYKDVLQAGLDSKRILIAEGDADISSSELRLSQKVVLEKKNLQLRVDECHSTDLMAAEALKDRFKHINTHFMRKEQSVQFSKLPKDKMISLDTVFFGKFNLPISRHYDLYGATKLRYGLRPNPRDTRSLKSHIKAIPPGTYSLFDDDIHTGRTMKFAKEMLERYGRHIDGVHCLTRSAGAGEILDARDFFLGNGLVTELPNKALVRLPYLYPYVCPYIRGSILDPKEFSIEMWRLNADIWRKDKLKIGQWRTLQPFAEYMGYAPDKPLHKICEEHVEMLLQVF